MWTGMGAILSREFRLVANRDADSLGNVLESAENLEFASFACREREGQDGPQAGYECAISR